MSMYDGCFARRKALSLLVCLGCFCIAQSACTDEEPEPTPGDMNAGVNNTTSPEPDMGSSPDMLSGRDMRVDNDMPGVDACDVPLSLTPATTSAIPFQSKRFVASGGTGNYRFEFTENNSEGILNDLTGDYLAGRIENVTDSIRLVDQGCQGSAEASVEVLTPMSVAPLYVELRPGQSFTFEVTRGSGSFAFALRESESDGAIDVSGRYVAGSKQGRDVVEITDVASEQTVEAVIEVSEQASFGTAAKNIYIPLGESHQLGVRGGSGNLDADINSDSIRIENGIITTKTPGVTPVTLRDRFTAEEVEISVHVVEPQQVESIEAGDFNPTNVLNARHDLDGDGHPDLVFSNPESDLDGWRSGAVFVFKGTASGFEKTPAQVFTGDTRDDFFGYSFDLRDLNLDGQVDLIVGARLANVGANDSGSVQVFEGVDGGFFKTTASLTFAGEEGGDQYGNAVETCDFNGDMRPDLVIGAIADEDRTQQPLRGSQGGAHVFLNYPGGFLAKPDISLWGKIPNANGEWINTSSVQLGRFMDVGDFDGDGLCDLAVTSDLYNGNRGLALIYRGTPPDDIGPGGVERTPSFAITSDVSNGRFGFQVALTDLNGDGKDDLAVSAFNEANDAGNGSAGAVYIFEGREITGPATTLLDADVADIKLAGDNTSDHFGWSLEKGDLTGDGIEDLLIASPADELEGQPGGTGVVHVLAAASSGALSALSPQFAFSIRGASSSDRFGQGMTPVQDRDGDGALDLAVFAARIDRIGLDVGDLLFAPSAQFDAPENFTSLDFDDVPGGAWIGSSTAFVGDLNGDGKPELAVGAPFREDASSNAINGGSVMIYTSTPTGFSTMPAKILHGFATHSSSDSFGWSVDSAGDFDGDGIEDLVVAGRLDDRPATYGSLQTDSMSGQTYYENGTYARNTCEDLPSSRRGDTGALYIFLGRDDGSLFTDQPKFIFHGPERSGQIRRVAGVGDVNRDGRDDVVFGSEFLDDGATNAGGFGVIYGRAATDPGKISPICNATRLFLGGRADSRLGSSISRAGDINGDGCADFAVGARLSDAGAGNQGQVRVILSNFNMNNNNCNINSARMVTLASGSANAQVGASVAGGADVTGDGVPDLVIGGPEYRVDGTASGAIWLVDGAYINTLTTRAIQPVQTVANANLSPMAPAAQDVPYIIEGNAPGDTFGTSVALVPGLGPNDTAAVVVGAPLADLGEFTDTGAVYVYRFLSASADREAGFDPVPYALFTGETERRGSLLGDAVCGWGGGGAWLGVGGYQSSALELDNGASFAFSLE